MSEVGALASRHLVYIASELLTMGNLLFKFKKKYLLITFQQEALAPIYNVSAPQSNDHAEDCETTTVRFCRFDFNKEASSEIVKAMLKNPFDVYNTFTEKGQGDTFLLLDFNQKIGL